MKQGIVLALLFLSASHADVMYTHTAYDSTSECQSIAPEVRDNVVRVTGHGAVRRGDVSDPIASIAAIRAAELDAQRKLVAATTDRRIDARSVSASYVQQSDEVREQIQGVLQRMRPLETRVLPDGTAELDAELTLDVVSSRQNASFAETPGTKPGTIYLRQVFYTGSTPSRLQSYLAAIDVGRSVAVRPSAPERQPVPPVPSWTQQTRRADGTVTDIVIDARGLGFMPSDTPELFVGYRRVFPFDEKAVKKLNVVASPKVHYTRKLTDTIGLPGFGPNPLMLKGDRVSKLSPRGLVLPMQSVAQLRTLKGSRLVQGEGYVVVVID